MRRRLVPILLFSAAAVALASPVRAQDASAQCIDASNQGLALRKQGKLVDARKMLVTCAVDACGADIKGTCTQRIAEITAALPTIVVLAKDGAGNDLAGVKVTVDGVALSAPLDGRAMTLDPGKHVFKLEATGQTPVEKELVLAEREKDRREVVVIGPPPAGAPAAPSTLPSTPPPAAADSSSWSTQKTLALVAGGVGIVGLGLGTVFGLQASSKWSSAQSDCGSGCGPNAPAQGEKSDAQNAGTLSTVGFAVGGVALAGAVVLWFTAPSGGDASPPPTTARGWQLVPLIGAGNGGAVLEGAF